MIVPERTRTSTFFSIDNGIVCARLFLLAIFIAGDLCPWTKKEMSANFKDDFFEQKSQLWPVKTIDGCEFRLREIFCDSAYFLN